MQKINNFSDFEVADEIKHAIEDMGFTEPTPIQRDVIPHLLAGRDVIAQAPTGTGKTAAFAIPIINNIDEDSSDIQALVLCPTRELVIQMANEFKEIMKYSESIRILPIYGGQNIDRQLIGLKRKPQIICGTPGRVMDHLRRRTLKLHNLKMFVLDEADEMLDMGFRSDLDEINKTCPRDKQVVLFSATMPKTIVAISKNYQVDPILVKTKGSDLPTIEQIAIKCKEGDKLGLVTDVLDAHNYNLTIAFCNTKRRVDELAASLCGLGYNAEALHGDLRQSQRDRVMKRYRAGETRVLVATDVAARGIDVENVQAIFNFDTPNDEEYYVHRIGRTARANKTGVAYTFYTKAQQDLISKYERYTKNIMTKMDKMQSTTDFSSKKLNNLFKGLDKNHTNTISFITKSIEEYNTENNSEFTALELLAVALEGAGSMVMTDNNSRDTRNRKEKLSGVPSTRFFMTIGTMDNTTDDSVKKFIMAKTSIPESAILEVKLLEKFGFAQIGEGFEDLMDALNNESFNGRKLNCEIAGERTGGGRGGDRGGDRGGRGGDRGGRSSFGGDRGGRGGYSNDRAPRREGGFSNDRAPRREGGFSSDRAPRTEGGYNNDRAPRREGGFSSDRAPRTEGGYNNDRAPRREGGYSNDRAPRTEGGYSNDRAPRREGGYSNDRAPRREGGFSSDRAPRREGGFSSDRAPRREGGFSSDRAPRREGGFSSDRAPRREGGFAPKREGYDKPKGTNFDEPKKYDRD